MQQLTIPLVLISAYLIGSIPTSVWIGKIFYGKDVRKEGSGNAGATNTIRVLGYKAGIPVLLFDVFKGWLGIYMINFINLGHPDPVHIDYIKIAAAILVVLGHIFPVFAGFRGGKGVATILGAGIALYGMLVVYAIFIFIIILVMFRYVSLASILAAISFFFVVLYSGRIDSLPLLILAAIIAAFIPLTHIKNIQRLVSGTESRFTISRKREKENG